jgi:hypothetical protein
MTQEEVEDAAKALAAAITNQDKESVNKAWGSLSDSARDWFRARAVAALEGVQVAR